MSWHRSRAYAPARIWRVPHHLTVEQRLWTLNELRLWFAVKHKYCGNKIRNWYYWNYWACWSPRGWTHCSGSRCLSLLFIFKLDNFWVVGPAPIPLFLTHFGLNFFSSNCKESKCKQTFTNFSFASPGLFWNFWGVCADLWPLVVIEEFLVARGEVKWVELGKLRRMTHLSIKILFFLIWEFGEIFREIYVVNFQVWFV